MTLQTTRRDLARYAGGLGIAALGATSTQATTLGRHQGLAMQDAVQNAYNKSMLITPHPPNRSVRVWFKHGSNLSENLCP
jgi:hypothetical protein